MVTDCMEKCSELVRFLMQNGGRLHGKEEYIMKCRSKSVGSEYNRVVFYAWYLQKFFFTIAC